MQKALFFAVLVLVVAVWLSAMVCVLMGPGGHIRERRGAWE